jgi:hypothetical protein
MVSLLSCMPFLLEKRAGGPAADTGVAAVRVGPGGALSFQTSEVPADGTRKEHTMGNLIHRVGRIGVVAAAATALAGCNLASTSSGPAIGPSVTVRQNVPATALLTVTTGSAAGPALSGLVASTAQPNEDIRILQAGTPAKTIVAS